MFVLDVTFGTVFPFFFSAVRLSAVEPVALLLLLLERVRGIPELAGVRLPAVLPVAVLALVHTGLFASRLLVSEPRLGSVQEDSISSQLHIQIKYLTNKRNTRMIRIHKTKHYIPVCRWNR